MTSNFVITCNSQFTIYNKITPKLKPNEFTQHVKTYKQHRVFHDEQQSLPLMAAATSNGSHKRRTKTQRSNPVTNSEMAAITTLPSSTYKWLTRLSVTAILLSFFFLFGISSNTLFASRKTQLNPLVYSVEIVNEFPHDPRAFTQGLVYWGNDTLYESTGLYGQVETQHKMDRSIFGEGLTLLGERLYQVTWLRKTGFIYERENFNNLTTFSHHMEDGWGLATDGKTLFGSDGSSTLYQMDPHTMKVIQKQTVKYEGHEVRYLNELEFINGEIWANIFTTDCIVRLSPSGNVVGWVFLHNLRESLIQAGAKNLEVLNGIAWDSDNQRIFVTGKLWPKLFEIKLHRMKDHSHVNIQKLCMRDVDLF
ncbi:glutaminyl-peptide cyclotransferase-like isoform X2 [Silene latifolia]|uniref:glutaminyl-peptide cyclotransferase-like isoform X2 n=1 Tax=Silene latifolia TaxID=37657 RepID=UPI003D777ADB